MTGLSLFTAVFVWGGLAFAQNGISMRVCSVAGTTRCVATPTLRLTLVIYDHANVRTETLAAAENTVSEIFRHANVQLIWRDGFAYAAERYGALNPAPDDPATLVVKLQPESEAVRHGVRSVCRGIGFPSGAIVFVRSFDARSTTSEATRLGYVIAHELGHMLLGPNAHTLVGIMRGTLLSEDWEKAAQGTPGFTPSQNQQIRTWIDQRTSTGDRTLTVLVLDYAGLPDSSLNEMESLSGLLLSRGGVRTQWVHCLGHQADPRPALCDKNPEPGSILIRILKTPIGSQNGLGDRVGWARIESRYASLNASEISKYAEHNELPADSLMAYAMTHEIGHLLLGVNHEPTGIMRAVWGKAELREIARGSLRFSTQERKALRHALAALGQPAVSLK